ncbi:cadherin repeat domain-containing protein [Vibrio parahaemolyticus]|uniref:cadherin repeat domain-containing protein n=1 Tax=Vibrio parahaemolyticus TaxID=670 RepID=UPI00111F6EE5|nr:cadherin repeat domain-containing protein [Vibrio parahaemolyticus]EGR3112789.1 D-Tyr-tRNAtyr deacylase [Vibrio parahaemolyticus]EJG1645278.1 cadherin repeat domain-containing protein [Vibrio parahaemolyticus]ELB2249343.1 cadherin repeat domain-containing protein [Vibrio parahaemolyticus]MBM5025200.1 cadherin repeat domain-containing protein [Vibrio parahaemolyticus]TNZ09171.1 D-Tyr-tRNAtyr deacylase [Vibrio parahaemolyticus]
MNRNYYLLFLAALLVGCGGGGDSKPNNTKTPTTITKQSRPQLKVEDTVLKFEGVGTVTEAKLSNVHGSVSYEVIDSNPPNVVKINDSGILQILRPGTATILATDSSSAYESSEARFSVTVERGINTELSVSDLNFNAIESEGKALTVRGQKGELSYEVESGHNLIRVDENGSVYSLGSVGQASMLITDSGNEFYLPKQVRATVKLHAVAPGQLKFALLEDEYRKGLTLEPVRLDKAQTQRISYKIINSVPDSKVAELLDPETGLLLVHNVGRLTVEATATYSDAFLDKQQTAQFFVDVKQGKRQEISAADIVTTYEEGGRIFPKVTNAYGDYELRIIRGEDVVAKTENGEALLIKGVGAAEVEIYEHDMRNYPASKTRFDLEVNRAPHPVIKDIEMPLTYQPNLSIPLAFKGQKGNVNLVSSLPNGLRMTDGKLEVVTAGEYDLKFEDDGGEFYQPIQFNVVIKVAKAEGQPMATHDYDVVYSNKYSFDLHRDFGLSADEQIEIVDNTAPDVVGGFSEGRLHVYKAGKATLTVRRKESANYTVGPDQKVYVTILSAPSRIEVQSDVEEIWKVDQTFLAPEISGVVGELTYRFEDNAATDVVSLNNQTGAMQILNAGSTKIIVSDAGDDKVNPGESSFLVTIKPGANPVSIAYPTVDFSAGTIISPVMSGGTAKASYRLINQKDPVVELVSPDTGRLKILHAGTYQVEVTLTGRNYKAKTIVVNGTINKAKHPGLSTSTMKVEFEPFKKVKLDFGTPIGKRSYQISGSTTNGVASLDVDKEELTLLDLPPINKRWISLDVSEGESRDYEELESKNVQVFISFADKGVADQYELFEKEQTVLISTLNKLEFSNLEESEFGLMNVRSVREPTDEELKLYGKGKVAKLIFKPVGNDDPTLIKAAWVHVARFDGCTSELFEDDLKPFQAIDYDDPGYCTSGSTIRMTRFLIIDDSNMEKVEYELVAPVIIYRRGQREFLPSDKGSFLESKPGGFYLEPGMIHNGNEFGKPRTLYEWSVINMKYQPN